MEEMRLQIVNQIMAANLADIAQSWIMQHDGTYTRAIWPSGKFAFNCHRFFMENASRPTRLL